MAAQKTKKKKTTFTRDRRNVWLLILTTLLVVGSFVLFVPPDEKINQGLDVQGGLSVVLTAKSTEGSEVSAEDMEKSRSIIEQRVNALGASETVVQLQGDDQILVQIPGLSDTEEALNTIGKTGQLVFARLDSFTDEEVKSNIEIGQIYTQETYTDEFGNSFPASESKPLVVEEGTYTPLVTGANIRSVSVGEKGQGSLDYAVNLELDSDGSAAFAEATRELAPDQGQIVIILDGEVQSAPRVDGEIPNGEVSITGDYTLDEAKALQTVLESGSLPVSFEYSQSQVVGPTLGQEALRSGVLVAGIGLLIVMLYLLFFYRGMGLITAGALVIFAVLYLGILAFLSAFGLFSLSLAGIAGVVLTIGMAADSSILTIERFREEIRMGRTVRAASITGVKHAIITSIDADLVTLISALSLFFLASSSVKGFGLTLALGIICDILMMLIFKAPLIRLLAPRSIAKHPGFWGVKDSLVASGNYKALAAVEGESVEFAENADEINPIESEEYAEARQGEAGREVAERAQRTKGRFIKRDINFLGHRRVFYIIAAIMIIGSFSVVGFKGLNFGIEFVGGTSVTFRETGAITTEEMRSAFEAAGEPNATIQTTTADGEEGFLIRTSTTSAEDAAVSANKVADSLGLSTESFEVTTIGPDWGTSVIQSSLIAFLVSIILIIIYIAFRFEYKMGIMAILSLLHDLIIVVGVYALVGREVNPNTIAALLTIIGYSLYDSVVVFHRINENMKDSDMKCTFMTMANHSINQVFIRTINTTMTTLIPVLAMLFFGGETLKDFAFAMTIGLICGSYSSIAIATPLYSMWKTREPRYAKLAKKYGPTIGRFDFDRPGAESPFTVTAKSSKKAAKAAKTAAGGGAEAVSASASSGGSASATSSKARSLDSSGGGGSSAANAKSGAQKASPQKTDTNGQKASTKQQSNHHYRRKKKDD